MKKDTMKVLAEAERQGFAVRRTRKGHFLVSKDGRPVVTAAGTPSDHRALANLLAALRRAGLQYPPPGKHNRRT